MYISELFSEFETLQMKHGSTDHDVIYGAGEIHSPKLFLVFMNPTARNVAKCTQVDARPLPNSVFREYRPSFEKEIAIVNPQKIVTFGNQVSSIAVGKPISVSGYLNDELVTISIGDRLYDIYPCYYPVGQGRRNMPIAKRRIKNILELT
jgi:uracil-DNA glycosylase